MRLAASHATTQSCPYGKYRPTRVPLPMPAASMRRASRRDSSSACANVMCPVGGDDEVVVGPVRDRVVQRLADRRAERELGGGGRRLHGRRCQLGRDRVGLHVEPADEPGHDRPLGLAADQRDPDAEVAADQPPARRVTGRGDGHGRVAVGPTADAVGREPERARRRSPRRCAGPAPSVSLRPPTTFCAIGSSWPMYS